MRTGAVLTTLLPTQWPLDRVEAVTKSASSNPRPSPVGLSAATREKWVFPIVAGGAAGTVELLALHPLDTLKTRLQQPGSFTLMQSVRGIAREGGASGFYAGMPFPLLVAALARAAKFTTYNSMQTALGSGGISPLVVEVIAGGVAGAAQATIAYVPTEGVKVRRQLHSNTANSWRVAWSMYAEGGLGCLFRGGVSTVGRDLVWNGVYFPINWVIKPWIAELLNQPENAFSVTFVSGLCGGFAATCANTPIDVIKTRIQAGGESTSMIEIGTRIFNEEGPRALYKGFVPKVVRLALGGGIQLVVFYEMLSRLRKEFTPA